MSSGGILDGGYEVSNDRGQLQAMISLDQVRPFLTATQKRKLKAALSMIGHILWDNDFVPIDNWHSFNSWHGEHAYPIQCRRAIRSRLLKDHPQFSARFADILDVSHRDSFINATSLWCAEGLSALCGRDWSFPRLDVFRQLQIGGYTDVFAPTSSIYDRLTGLAEWTMQVMTPTAGALRWLAQDGLLRRRLRRKARLMLGADHGV